jgi:RNA polymerase sigma factor (TIGR02999 family)
LRRWRGGDDQALAELLPAVEQELRRIARGHMRAERRDHILQTTALVNEAYLRLLDAQSVDWQDRAHFFAITARLMRRVLVDSARARDSRKRGGDRPSVQLSEIADLATDRAVDVLALDLALEKLAGLDVRKANVLELRFFGGLTTAEVGAVLQISADTVKRDLRFAKLWLLRELGGSHR